MPLISLTIKGVRNLADTSLEPHPRLNLIMGANASGKTSLLEAIYLLGVGKSFRTARVDNVCQRGAIGLGVTGVYRGKTSKNSLSYQRLDGKTLARINNAPAGNMAILAQHMPVQAVSTDTHFSFLKHAKYRRAVLDWGLFHVEPGFYDLWVQYQRLLRQRNAALKHDAGVSAWDKALAEKGEAIHSYRAEYLTNITHEFRAYCDALMKGSETDLRLHSGWHRDLSFTQALVDSRARDLERGFTHTGAHRADLIISLAGQDARQEASQGQWKLLMLALRLAQLKDFVHRKGGDCILLLDDLAAELDAERCRKVMAQLASLPLQVFVTATEMAAIDPSPWDSYRLFHVEHGVIDNNGNKQMRMGQNRPAAH